MTRFARVPPHVARMKLGGHMLRVLIALCTFANAEGECWPSISTLEKETDLSRQKVSWAIKKLVAAGVVTKLPGKRGSITRYRINFDDEVSPLGGTAGVPIRGDTRRTEKGDTGVPIRGDEVSPLGGTRSEQPKNSPIEQPSTVPRRTESRSGDGGGLKEEASMRPITSDAELREQARTDRDGAVVRLLSERGPLTPHEIARVIGRNGLETRRLVYGMHRYGEVERVGDEDRYFVRAMSAEERAAKAAQREEDVREARRERAQAYRSAKMRA